jgi:hypothetical protein
MERCLRHGGKVTVQLERVVLPATLQPILFNRFSPAMMWKSLRLREHLVGAYPPCRSLCPLCTRQSAADERLESKAVIAVIRAQDEAGNVIDAHEHAGDFK